ncbi:MAG TPA: RNA 2',3'-cyclic phosphodiesterase, partial [Gemmatimonadales bacterium]|nr:RNA 2',3'-cyclic phosphodiesterase [Gemmatimonadales bacterium]
VRLFVAVNLPPEERRRAWEAAQPMRAAHLPVRWSAPETLHLTLKFLGEVEPERVGPIGEALAGAVRKARPFTFTLGGIGAFPSVAKPRVVWLGIEHHPALELLANDVELALMGLSFEPELRPFSPHLTLGRAERSAKPAAFRDFAGLAEQIAYEGTATVESVDLMQSILGPQGASYTVLARAPLGAAAVA